MTETPEETARRYRNMNSARDALDELREEGYRRAPRGRPFGHENLSSAEREAVSEEAVQNMRAELRAQKEQEVAMGFPGSKTLVFTHVWVPGHRSVDENGRPIWVVGHWRQRRPDEMPPAEWR